MATLDGAPKSARVQISDDDASLPVLVSPHRASRHKRDWHCVSDHERDCRLDFPTRMAPGGVPPRRCVLDRPIGSAGAPRGARPPPFHAFLGGPCSHRPGETGVVPPDCVLPRSSPPASLAPLLGRPVDALLIPHSTHFLAPYDTLRPEPGCVPPGCALPPPPLSTGSTRGSCAHPPGLAPPPPRCRIRVSREDVSCPGAARPPPRPCRGDPWQAPARQTLAACVLWFPLPPRHAFVGGVRSRLCPGGVHSFFLCLERGFACCQPARGTERRGRCSTAAVGDNDVYRRVPAHRHPPSPRRHPVRARRPPFLRALSV